MLRSISQASAAMLMALSMPLYAQDQNTETDAPATDGTAQLDLGEPVGDGPQLGERYSKEKFGDWDLACIKTEGETDPCSLLQIMNDQDGNPIAEFSLFRIADGGQAVAGATIIVPLETLLPAQITMSVDGAPGKRYNYSFCNPIGCVAQIGMTQGDVDAFKRGASAKLSLRPAPAPDQIIELEMSLSGFTAGFDVVDVVQR
ncbi:MAG: invasion associated locus B family protein [Arenibacterium sp.]